MTLNALISLFLCAYFFLQKNNQKLHEKAPFDGVFTLVEDEGPLVREVEEK